MALWSPFAFAALIALTVSCTTTPKIDKNTLPEALRVQFEPCVPRDGTAELAFTSRGKVIATDVTLDFLAKGAGKQPLTLAAELSNPLGQTLMTVSQTPPSRAIVVKGRRIPKALRRQLATDDKGYITIDGTSAGIKLSELICALGGVWPEPWLDRLTAFAIVSSSAGGKSAKLVSADDSRTIKLTLPITGQMPKRCAAIEVRYALGLHSEQLALCLDPSRSLGSLSHTAKEGQDELRWAIVTD